MVDKISGPSFDIWGYGACLYVLATKQAQDRPLEYWRTDRGALEMDRLSEQGNLVEHLKEMLSPQVWGPDGDGRAVATLAQVINGALHSAPDLRWKPREILEALNGGTSGDGALCEVHL
jgi:hypothetical protein